MKAALEKATTAMDFRVALAEQMKSVLGAETGVLKNMDMFEKLREGGMRIA